MKFDSKSVLLNDGVSIKVSIHVPEILKSLSISKEIWQIAVINFNKKLNERSVVTENVNGLSADILQLELSEGNSLIMAMSVNRGDVQIFGDKWFGITGQIIFKGNSWNEVEAIDISDLIYKNAGGDTTHRVINKT